MERVKFVWSLKCCVSLELSAAACPFVHRSSEAVFWRGFCRLCRCHTRVLVGLYVDWPFVFFLPVFHFQIWTDAWKKNLCPYQTPSNQYSLNFCHNMSSLLAAVSFLVPSVCNRNPAVSPSTGFTAGWTTLRFVCSRGWSRTASRTRSCMKELF